MQKARTHWNQVSLNPVVDWPACWETGKFPSGPPSFCVTLGPVFIGPCQWAKDRTPEVVSQWEVSLNLISAQHLFWSSPFLSICHTCSTTSDFPHSLTILLTVICSNNNPFYFKIFVVFIPPSVRPACNNPLPNGFLGNI